MTWGELRARDEALLEEAWQAAEAVIDGTAPGVYLPSWGCGYDPYRLLAAATDQGVFRLALVSIRQAMHPEESWAKCAHCMRLYLVEAYGGTCSPECFAVRSNFLDNQ